MKRALLTLFYTLSALAQWPTSPLENLLVCDHTGEQALPKIAATSDGGCYVTWWDHASGNYDVYLQRFDSEGVPQWTTPCGMLVSDYPQSTSLTDWDMAVDADDNCIIAVNDIRNGTDRDITVYKMGPQQEALWGVEGIMLSMNDGFEPDPRIAPMDNGDVVFAWQEETVIHLRRLNSAGGDVFSPETITITNANPLSIPRISKADSGAVLLSYLIHQGTQFNSPRHIYLQKLSTTGNMLWNPGGVAVMTTNGIGIQMRPDVIHDGNGGAYSFWYDTRNNVHHCFVQHVTAGGVAEWTANGVQIDLSANELQMSPSAVLAENGIVVYYQTANTSQSQGGIDAQYLAANGTYLWNTAGVTIAPLSTSPCFNVRALRQLDAYSVFYSQYAPGSAIHTLLRASQLDEAGAPQWTPPVKDLCSVVSEKGRPHATANPLGQIIAAWPDSRTASMDIYLQNINVDGELGPNTVFPPAVIITSPEDMSTVGNANIDIVFEVENFFIDPNNGDGYVSVMVNDQDPNVTNEVAPYPVTLSLGLNLITLEILDLAFQPLVPPVIDSVHVNYTQLHPAITITWPSQPPDVSEWYNDWYPFVHFEVMDFVIADSGGDGRLRLQVRDFWQNEEPFVDSSFVALDSFEVPLWYFTVNEIMLSLVDNSGMPLVPHVTDTVYVRAWQIAADDPALLPSSFILHDAYPNPFNSTVTLAFDVPAPAHLSLDIVDVTGRHVATIFNEVVPVGSHSTQWQADNSPSGLYFVRLSSGSFTQTQKIVLLK